MANTFFLRDETERFGEVGRYGRPTSIDLDTVSINNNKGDTLLVTYKEVKDVIYDILHDELNLFTSERIRNYKANIELQLDDKFKQIEASLMRHISDKIDKLSEEIIKKVLERVIQEEVDKRVSDKWDEIKKQI